MDLRCQAVRHTSKNVLSGTSNKEVENHWHRLIRRNKSNEDPPCAHVLCGEYKDTFRTDPILGWSRFQLDAFDVENSGTRLATDDFALFVTNPTVTVVVGILKINNREMFNSCLYFKLYTTSRAVNLSSRLELKG